MFQSGDRIEFRSSDPQCANGWKPGIAESVAWGDDASESATVRIQTGRGVWIRRPAKIVRHATA